MKKELYEIFFEELDEIQVKPFFENGNDLRAEDQAIVLQFLYLE